MKLVNTFPEWIIDAINKNQSGLNTKSKDFFKKIIEIHPHFNQTFLSIPETSDIGLLKSYAPSEVKNYYGIESPHEFILLNIIELFHFQAMYQLRELSLSLLNNLSEGRFYVSAITNRAMLEVVCVNYYTFRRVEKKHSECVNYLKSTINTKSSLEKSKLLDKYYQGTYDIFCQVFNANAATSIDWQKHLQEKFDIKISAGDDVKKVHVNDAIKDLEEQSKLPLFNAYNLLSEFVHPNAGSKMLIINTKRLHDPLMDVITIGDNKTNPEAALFYFDNLAESMYYTWTLSLTLFDRSQKLISVLDRIVTGVSSKNVH